VTISGNFDNYILSTKREKEYEHNCQRKREKGNQIFLLDITHQPLVGIMNASYYWI
jgi:hypothetical protein